MNGAQTTQPTTSKPAMTQVNTDVTLGGLFVTQDSHDTHMAARTDWVNHDWGSDAVLASPAKLEEYTKNPADSVSLTTAFNIES